MAKQISVRNVKWGYVFSQAAEVSLSGIMFSMYIAGAHSLLSIVLLFLPFSAIGRQLVADPLMQQLLNTWWYGLSTDTHLVLILFISPMMVFTRELIRSDDGDLHHRNGRRSRRVAISGVEEAS